MDQDQSRMASRTSKQRTVEIGAKSRTPGTMSGGEGDDESVCCAVEVEVEEEEEEEEEEPEEVMSMSATRSVAEWESAWLRRGNVFSPRTKDGGFGGHPLPSLSVRLRVHFEEIRRVVKPDHGEVWQIKSDPRPPSWVLVPSSSRYVSDVLQHLRNTFGVSSTCPCALELDGAAIPLTEPALILRDNDSVTMKIRYNNHAAPSASTTMISSQHEGSSADISSGVELQDQHKKMQQQQKKFRKTQHDLQNGGHVQRATPSQSSSSRVTTPASSSTKTTRRSRQKGAEASASKRNTKTRASVDGVKVVSRKKKQKKRQKSEDKKGVVVEAGTSGSQKKRLQGSREAEEEAATGRGNPRGEREVETPQRKRPKCGGKVEETQAAGKLPRSSPAAASVVSSSGTTLSSSAKRRRRRSLLASILDDVRQGKLAAVPPSTETSRPKVAPASTSTVSMPQMEQRHQQQQQHQHQPCPLAPRPEPATSPAVNPPPSSAPASVACSTSYESLPRLIRPPMAGYRIAYRILELTHGCPSLSEFKEARILEVDGMSQDVTLEQIWPLEAPCLEPRFDFMDVDEHGDEEAQSSPLTQGQVFSCPLSALSDIRVVDSSAGAILQAHTGPME